VLGAELFSQLVAGASRRRAAPRNVFDEPLRGGSSRFGTVSADIHISEPQLACSSGFANAMTMNAPLCHPPQANPSVNLRANGWPLQATWLSSFRGQPSSPGYLER
jgi:hypothetical protein